jgi:hypothetical protein
VNEKVASYRRIQGSGAEIIRGRGPLLGPLVVGLVGATAVEATVLVKYVTENLDETLSSIKRLVRKSHEKIVYVRLSTLKA